MATTHQLAQLIDGVKAANGWSDPDLVRNAKEKGHVLSKSNISRYRGPLVSIKGEVIIALAAGLRVAPAQVAVAAIQSMGIQLSSYDAPTPEQAVQLDTELAARDKRAVLALLAQLRDSPATSGTPTEVDKDQEDVTDLRQAARKVREVPVLDPFPADGRVDPKYVRAFTDVLNDINLRTAAVMSAAEAQDTTAIHSAARAFTDETSALRSVGQTLVEQINRVDIHATPTQLEYYEEFLNNIVAMCDGCTEFLRPLLAGTTDDDPLGRDMTIAIGLLSDLSESAKNSLRGLVETGRGSEQGKGGPTAWPAEVLHVRLEGESSPQAAGFDVDLDLPKVVPTQVSPYVSAAFVSAMNGIRASVADITEVAKERAPLPQAMVDSLSFAADDFETSTRRLVVAMQNVELDATREQIDSALPLFDVSARFADAVYRFIGHVLVGAPNDIARANFKGRQSAMRGLVDFLEVAETSWRDAGLSSPPDPALAAARPTKPGYRKGKSEQGEASNEEPQGSKHRD